MPETDGDDQVVGPDGVVRGSGYRPKDRVKHPYGATPGVSAFKLPIIPRNEWAARIEEIEKSGSLISTMMLNAGIPSEDQSNTNFCWGNAQVTVINALRCKMGESYVPLSPASVCAPVTGYRNVGGYGMDALQYIIDHGVAPKSLWPANAINRQYDNSASQNARSLYRCTEWMELESNDFDQAMTCLLLKLPFAAGYNFWSHEIGDIDPVYIGNGVFGIRFRNSWGDSYGTHGFGILAEPKAVPSDADVPLTMTSGGVPVAANGELATSL